MQPPQSPPPNPLLCRVPEAQVWKTQAAAPDPAPRTRAGLAEGPPREAGSLGRPRLSLASWGMGGRHREFWALPRGWGGLLEGTHKTEPTWPLPRDPVPRALGGRTEALGAPEQALATLGRRWGLLAAQAGPGGHGAGVCRCWPGTRIRRCQYVLASLPRVGGAPRRCPWARPRRWAGRDSVEEVTPEPGQQLGAEILKREEKTQARALSGKGPAQEARPAGAGVTCSLPAGAGGTCRASPRAAAIKGQLPSCRPSVPPGPSDYFLHSPGHGQVLTVVDYVAHTHSHPHA